MTDRGNWIQTFTGRQFFPLDPRPEEIDIYDISHALSQLCRFGGHVKQFYSVAEHCVLMSYNVPYEYALWALLHDASEAYCVDLPRPIKHMLPDYRVMEDKIIAAIAKRFQLAGTEIPEIVHVYDARILADERIALMQPPPAPWAGDAPPLGVEIQGWWPGMAENRFYDRLSELLEERRWAARSVPR